MSLATLLRSVSPARLMGRATSNDPRPAVTLQDDLPPSNIPELECEPFRNFYEEHINFLELYSKIGYSVNGLAQLLRNSMAESSISATVPNAAGRARMAPPSREMILECAKLMKEIVLVFKTVHAHVEAKTHSVKKDIRRYDPVRHFNNLRDLDQHMLEEFFNREAGTVNQGLMQSAPQQRPVRETGQGAAQESVGRITQPGSSLQTHRSSGAPPLPRAVGYSPRGESGVSQSAEPTGMEDPTQASQTESPRNKNPIGNWSFGRWFPRSRSNSGGSSRGTSGLRAPLHDPSEAVDAMNLEPGSCWTGAPARNIRNQQGPSMAPRLETF